jgi:hypothetical protein
MVGEPLAPPPPCRSGSDREPMGHACRDRRPSPQRLLPRAGDGGARAQRKPGRWTPKASEGGRRRPNPILGIYIEL